MCYKITPHFVQPHTRKGKKNNNKKEKEIRARGKQGGGIKRRIIKKERLHNMVTKRVSITIKGGKQRRKKTNRGRGGSHYVVIERVSCHQKESKEEGKFSRGVFVATKRILVAIRA